MGESKGSKGKKKARKTEELPLQAKRAADVKGGIIAGAGAGGGPHVKVFDGKTG